MPFAPRRSLKRIARANRDVVTARMEPSPSAEQYSLFRSYIDARHGDGGMAEMSVLDYSLMVEDSVVETSVTEYRLKPDPETGDAPLIGVSLCDRLSDGISMVYSFYDPDQPARSLGTYMILEQVEYARSLRLPFVYLGYWIDGSRKMRYKNRFQPQEHLTSKGWVRTLEMPEAELPEVPESSVRTSGRISPTWGSPLAACARPGRGGPTNRGDR